MIQGKSVPLGILCLLMGTAGLVIGLITRQWLTVAAFGTFASAGLTLLSDRTAFLVYALVFSSMGLFFLRDGLAPNADASAKFIGLVGIVGSVAMWFMTLLALYLGIRSRQSGQRDGVER